jgi:DNA-binding GntR family transcriptional regulator
VQATGVTEAGQVMSSGSATEPLYVKIAHNIRAEILDGQLQPGQRLREVLLAERYGVSRVPVRDAIRRLETERLVDVKPHAGAFVASVSAAEAGELLEVRLVLEELIVSRAALERTAADIDELRSIVAAGQRSVRGARPADLVALNTAFHRALSRISGNSTAAGLVEQIRARVELLYAGKLPRRARASWEEHEAILAAIVAGDPEAAGARLREHLVESARPWWRSGESVNTA